jgi:predicted RNase H-like HicB family nuclease
MKKKKKINPITMAKEYQLIVYWSEEDEAFLAEAPELNGCITHGETEKEALKNGRDAIVSWLEAAEEFKIPIPAPNKDFSGQFVVRLGKSLHRDLVKKALAEGLSLNQLVQNLLRKAV